MQNNTKTPLEQRLTSRIRLNGPMTMAEYMHTCLHDQRDGYYATQPGLGQDFMTAPKISQIFGELIGIWCAYEWNGMGSPDALNLVELGPGEADMMQDIWRATAMSSGFHNAAHLYLLEASPILRSIQSKNLQAAAPEWINSLESLSPNPSLIVANEYLDCFPVRQFVKSDTHWHERLIGLDTQGALNYGLSALLETLPFDGDCKNIDQIEIQPQLENFVMQLARHFTTAPGRALIIDYGHISAPPDDSLRAYKNGQQVDPLEMPGQSDLTVDVDFSALKHLAKTMGLNVSGPIYQSTFLSNMGIWQRLAQLEKLASEKADILRKGVEKLTKEEEMGKRFCAIAISSPELATPVGF